MDQAGGSAALARDRVFYTLCAGLNLLALKLSLLPRMHDRYFFPADMFAFLFACLVPRAWWIAVLFQAGSALAYAQYLASSVPDFPVDTYYAAHVGAVAMIAAIAGVVWFYRPYVRKAA